MPDFATAFTVKASDRTLTHNELVRAIRLMIADEFEAVQVYTQLAESIENELAREVLLDIADEERVHAGEFQRLLFELAPGEKELYAQGAVEVEEKIAGQGQKSQGAPGSGPLNPGELTVGSLKE
jgi:rubrerythrin